MSTISTIRLKLTTPDGEPLSDFGSNSGSLMHGLIMQHIEKSYASELHDSGKMKPFSQYVNRNSDGSIMWKISSLDEKSTKNIVDVLHDKAAGDNLFIKHKKREIKASLVEDDKISYNELVTKHMIKEAYNRRISLELITPCTFKSAGEYQLFPYIEHIYMNLIKRWEMFSGGVNIFDEDAVKHLISHTHIHSYSLKTKVYPLEGVYIKAFYGRLTLNIKGPENLVRLANMVLNYAGHAGLGIKTALGMGGINVKI